MPKREKDLRRLLEHVCAYCGRLKSERPPEWCVRAHEVHEVQQGRLALRVLAAERAESKGGEG